MAQVKQPQNCLFMFLAITFMMGSVWLMFAAGFGIAAFGMFAFTIVFVSAVMSHEGRLSDTEDGETSIERK